MYTCINIDFVKEGRQPRLFYFEVSKRLSFLCEKSSSTHFRHINYWSLHVRQAW